MYYYNSSINKSQGNKMSNKTQSSLQSIQELERSILYAFAEDKELLDYALITMNPNDFYFQLHRTIFIFMKALVDEEMDFTVEDLAEIIHEVNNEISIDIVLEVFFTPQSENPKKDIHSLQEHSINRYGLEQQIAIDNVTMIGIDDKNCLWSAKYINNELYEVEGNIIIDRVPAEYKLTLSETLASINDESFSGGGMCSWNEDDESITKYLFKK